MAQPLCMKPSARPRLDEGHDSDTSAAPLAHTPPMPKPRKMRRTANCTRVLAKPQRNVKIEYSATLSISARVRPKRSAIRPEITPPTAAATSMIDPRMPPSALVSPRSALTAGSTSANSITSNASSIHPNVPAISARRAAPSASRHHPNTPLSAEYSAAVVIAATTRWSATSARAAHAPASPGGRAGWSATPRRAARALRSARS